MVLAAGARLGPYEVIAPLGAGGMGEVYRARDTRLQRTVAIKVLHERLGSDAQFQERFKREARAISQLDHPHVCTLYDVGEQDGTSYLVMQYLEGETLASRLQRVGALPLGPALTIASEIADALDKAHRAGIIHRDLKPGNIFLTKSGAKLLDFGLAKNLAPPGAPDDAESTKPEKNRTAEGTLLGTVQYMAPEQIEGLPADARTDIFAFGAVLYEMLTGRKAFQGRSQASLMGAILRDEPAPASQVQPLVSPLLEHVVRTCLAKNPDDRFQTAHDLRLQLRWIGEGGSAVGAPTVAVARRKRRLLVTDIALGVALLLLFIALVPAGLYFWGPADDREIQFAVATPDMPAPLLVTVSPDGRLVAFVAPPSPGSKRVLWIRPLKSTAAQPVAGTEGAFAPFWSPDSRSVGFQADGRLKRVGITGGPTQTLCEIPGFANATWNRDDVILFSNGTVLQRVSAEGGEPVAVTQLDSLQEETAHRWPSFLPDGRHFLYSTWSGKPEKRAIVVGSLDSAARTRLLGAESMAVYAKPGYLLFHRAGTLFAQPFDASRMRLTGGSVPVIEHVAFVPRSGRAAFDVSQTGILVYIAGQGTGPTFTLSWFDRRGKILGTVGEPGPYKQIRLSPDDQRVAVERMDSSSGTWDIWTVDLSSNILTRLTFDPAHDQDPVWSQDGQSVVYASQRTGKLDFFQKKLGATGDSILFEFAGSPQYPADVSRDGRFLVYHSETVLYALPLQGDRKPITLDHTPFKKDHPRLSPDTTWVAYESEESGTRQIYVASFPAFDNRRQLTATGGAQPQWRADGKELFYVTLDGRLMAIDVNASQFGVPRALFKTPLVGNTCCLDQYAVTRDGQRFLFPVREAAGTATPPITVVVNWTAALKSP